MLRLGDLVRFEWNKWAVTVRCACHRSWLRRRDLGDVWLVVEISAVGLDVAVKFLANNHFVVFDSREFESDYVDIFHVVSAAK